MCTVWSVLCTGNETNELPRVISGNPPSPPPHLPFLLSWLLLHVQLGCPGAVAPALCERVFLRSGLGSQSPHWGGGHKDMVTLGAALCQCTENQGQDHLETKQDVSPISHSDLYFKGQSVGQSRPQVPVSLCPLGERCSPTLADISMLSTC